MQRAEIVRNLLQMGSPNLLARSLMDYTWNAFASCLMVTDDYVINPGALHLAGQTLIIQRLCLA